MDLHDTPAGTPPTGVIPNLESPDDQFDLTVGCVIAALALTVPLIAVKLFTKAHVLKLIQYEDYMLLVAQVLFIAWCALLLKDPNHNAHIWDTRASQIPRMNRFGNIIITFYSPTILFTKSAAILQIQRIFAVTPFNRIWWTSQCLFCSSTIFYTVIFFSTLFQCNPRRKIWHDELPGTCLSLTGIMGASAIWNVLINVGILVLPVIALRGSRISRRKKAIVLAVFGVSFLAMVASIGRLVSTISLANTDDWTYQLEGQGMLALGEITFMLIAAAVPTAPAFVRWLRGALRCRESEKANDGFDVRAEAQRPRPGPGDIRRVLDEETGTLETDIGASTILGIPPAVDLDAPLPPPLVPPKDERYASTMTTILTRTKASGSKPEKLKPKANAPKAPPPSPVAARDTVIMPDDNELECQVTNDEGNEEQESVIAAIIQSLQPAHLADRTAR